MMEAEIYYLSGQEHLLAPLQDHLKSLVYAGLTFTMRQISTSSCEYEFTEVARQYVKLLQASISPLVGLEVELKVMESNGYRLYIDVYYTMYGRKSFPELKGFFPAVAIRERMALVPTGLGDRLRPSLGALSPFQPFDLGGFLEVNFEDISDLDGAAEQVGRRLRKDFLQEVRAYAAYQESRELSLDRAAKDLSVDPGFVREVLEIEAGGALAYQGLTCSFDRSEFPLGVWSKVNLIVDNPSKDPLEDLEVEVAGPAKILPSRIRLSVPARGGGHVQMAIMPAESGEFPLELTFALPEDRPIVDWLPFHIIWLSVND